MIALSTAYNISKHKDPVSMVEEIKSLGFSAIELNVEVPESFISEIAKRIKIVSVHNYCPRIDFIPTGKTIYSPYNMTSTDGNERTTAVKLTKKTIDVANSVGAEAIVIHAGEIDMKITGRALAKKYNETKYKKNLWNEGLQSLVNGTNSNHKCSPNFSSGERSEEADYKNYLETFLLERKAKSKIFLENLLKSFDELIIYAERKNVKIGVENRFWADEIPSLADYEIIFDRFNSNAIGFWYDVGHSIVAEKQGLVKNHLDFLEKYSDRLIGVHLHDVIDVYDHKAPGTGEVNFMEISKFINSDALIVNETHLPSTKEDLKNSIEYLKNNGFHRFMVGRNKTVVLI